MDDEIYYELKAQRENEESDKKWEKHFNWDEPNYRFDEEAWTEVEQERNRDHAMDNKI